MVVGLNHRGQTNILVEGDTSSLIFLRVLVEELGIHSASELIRIEGRNELGVDLRDVEIQKDLRELLIVIRLAHVELWISSESCCDILSISEAL